ncbi:hypothetical protein BH10BAC4_BH10BAC4_06960 [soil metagenome]
MKKVWLGFALLMSLLTGPVVGQVGQITLNRVEQMPNMPAPYKMRNWKEVAVKYDQYVFSSGAIGQYLPLIHIKASGINYPLLQPILLDTYVGSASAGSQAEGINIIPSLVGATLVGANKSNQNGMDWTSKTKDFFNLANSQNVYLNGYSSSSGGDWWYDVMPNIFFYQLYSQYPNTPDYSQQFTSVANRWLGAVNAMGASSSPWTIPQMNYRAFNFSTMTPLASGVIEPEAAGGIAWLLYHAYLKTGDEKYLTGAQQSIEFLSGLTSNPSYELQLPYGTFIAAKMNAEIGSHYDIEKMLNWSFNRGALRGWGTIVGKWNGSDVSGLVGEANDGGNDYAFALNGFQQAAALVPLVKYDKRFARAIGKWTLNLANASRLYYPKYLPSASQDDFGWSISNDPESVIGYEALKENSNGKLLYGTGDAKRNGWAQTNLGLYGSSSVGYLAAVVDTTNVSGVLRLDLNRTDFYGENKFPSYLIFNPYGSSKQVILPLGPQTYDIYNAISETIIKTGVTGDVPIDVPADEAVILVYLPQGSSPVARNGKLYLGDDVVDFNLGYNFMTKLRIKSLATTDSLVQFNQNVPLYSAIDSPAGTVTYNWYINGVLSLTSTAEAFTWTVPAVAGKYKILLEITSAALSAKDSVMLRVVQRIPVPPVITDFTTDKDFYYTGTAASITCNASNSFGGALQFAWTFSGGSIASQSGPTLNWNVPTSEGLYTVACQVTNSDNLKTTFSKQILVKKIGAGATAPFAYYSLDGNVLDNSGNGHDGVLQGAQPAMDSRGLANKAYKFSTSADVISVANTMAMNFQNAITLSFWVRLDGVPQETFILSHGSYEERWKVSVTPDKKLRWTVKTSTSVKDLDSSFPLELNRFYHFTVVYSGYSMELYADGSLNAYLANSGLISITGKPLTLGRKDLDIANYYLRGTLDEVRIYDKALAPDEIATLKTIFSAAVITGVKADATTDYILYPNPAKGVVFLSTIADQVRRVELMDITGRMITSSYSVENHKTIRIDFDKGITGVIIMKIGTPEEVVYRKMIATQ